MGVIQKCWREYGIYNVRKLWKLTAQKIVSKPKNIITLPPLFMNTFSELISGLALGIKKYIIEAGII